MKVEGFYRAKTIEDALTLLNQEQNAKIIAGGTDFVIALNERQITPSTIIDISGVKEMRCIWEDGDTLHIGATATFSDIQHNELIKKYCPSLCEAASQMGAVQIRNLATLGGNVANVATAADGIPPLLSMDACVEIRWAEGSRYVPISEVVIGINQNSLAENEMITEFQISTKPNVINVFEKIGRRKALAISRINLALCAEMDGNTIIDIAVAVGAVGKTAYRVKEVEDFLKGKELLNTVIDDASDLIDEVVACNLVGRSTTPYKRRIAWAALNRALKRIVRGEKYE